MVGFRVLLLISVICGVAFSAGERPKRRPHWLDLEYSQLTRKEKEIWNHYDDFFNLLDTNNNNKITKKEILTALSPPHNNPEGDAKEVFKLFDLRQNLAGYKETLMHLTTFKDMWYIMTEVKHLVKDSEKVPVLLPFFKHVDTNEDGSISMEEMAFLVKTGGRNPEMSHNKTEHRPLLRNLDKDQSGGLSHEEVWAPIKEIIESEGETTMSCIDMAKHAQKDSYKKETLKLLCECIDRDNDRRISSTSKFNLMRLLDRNYSEEVEEHELVEMNMELSRCVFKKNNPDEERRKAERKQEALNAQLGEMAASAGKDETVNVEL